MIIPPRSVGDEGHSREFRDLARGRDGPGRATGRGCRRPGVMIAREHEPPASAHRNATQTKAAAARARAAAPRAIERAQAISAVSGSAPSPSR